MGMGDLATWFAGVGQRARGSDRIEHDHSCSDTWLEASTTSGRFPRLRPASREGLNRFAADTGTSFRRPGWDLVGCASTLD